MIDLLEPEPAGPTLPRSITADRWTRLPGWLCPPALRHLVEMRRDARGRVEWRLRARVVALSAPPAPLTVIRSFVPSGSRPESRVRRIAREMLQAHPEVTARQVADAAEVAADTAAHHLRILVAMGVATALPGRPGRSHVIYRLAQP